MMIVPRSVRLEISTIVEPLEGECPDCGFDALRIIRGFHLSPSGVNELFTQDFCGRCRAEEKRARHGDA